MFVFDFKDELFKKFFRDRFVEVKVGYPLRRAVVSSGFVEGVPDRFEPSGVPVESVRSVATEVLRLGSEVSVALLSLTE